MSRLANISDVDYLIEFLISKEADEYLAMFDYYKFIQLNNEIYLLHNALPGKNIVITWLTFQKLTEKRHLKILVDSSQIIFRLYKKDLFILN